MVRLTEIFSDTSMTNFNVRSVFLNPSHIVMVRDEPYYSKLLNEGKFNDLGISSNMEFSRITVRGGSGNYDVVVAGSSMMVYEKMTSSQKSLLKG